MSRKSIAEIEAEHRARIRKLEETLMLVRVAAVLDIIDKMRAGGATADKALWALKMATLDLEVEVREGRRQRWEGLRLERNHRTDMD